mmetsp:Transcript_32045/g.37658  ORF Transcript_32045/g.37658 Transcript_32045/m.37658 type:complete len:302 (-) Transcript_32045:98-1003(-)
MAKVKSRVSLPSECSICSLRTVGVPSKPVLICSLCSKEAHLRCTMLSEIPNDEWLCSTCQLKSNSTNVWGDLADNTEKLASTLQEMASQAMVANQRTQQAMHKAEQMEISEVKWRSERRQFEQETKNATSRARKAEKALKIAENRALKAETECDYLHKKVLASNDLISQLKHHLIQAEADTADISKQLSSFGHQITPIKIDKKKSKLEKHDQDQYYNIDEIIKIENEQKNVFPNIYDGSSSSSSPNQSRSSKSSPKSSKSPIHSKSEKDLRYLFLSLSRLEASIENASTCLIKGKSSLLDD